MSKNGMTLLGAKELERTFKSLGVRVQRRVTRQAVNAATTPVVKAARQKARKQSGTLRKSLGKKVKTYTKSMTVVGIVGPRREVTGEYKGKTRRPANYSHLIEQGFVAADGSHVPADPFLRPAFDQTKGQALGIMQDKLAAGVVKEARKAGGAS